MVRHIVAWNYKEELSEQERLLTGERVKESLEAICPLVEGAVSIHVELTPLSSGNRSVILSALFQNEEALSAYQAHPKHQEAGVLIRSVLVDRACADFVE